MIMVGADEDEETANTTMNNKSYNAPLLDKKVVMRSEQPGGASFSQAAAQVSQQVVDPDTVDAMGSPLADSMRRKKFKKMANKAQ